MKKAIALLFTLIFMTIVFSILSGILLIYKKFTKDTLNISQTNILIRDISKVLSKLDLNNTKKLYVTYPVFYKNFKAIIRVLPLVDKVDINSYPKIEFFLNNILEYYQVNYPEFFKALIKDTIDKDKKETLSGSEIILEDSFFKNGKIYNFSHFKRVLDYYVKKTQDKSIYSIPWKELIWFGDGRSIIDCNIINEKVANFLGLKYNYNLDCESLKEFESNKVIMNNFNIIPFNKSNSYPIKINIKYNSKLISIKYDFAKKRIEDIKEDIIY